MRHYLHLVRTSVEDAKPSAMPYVDWPERALVAARAFWFYITQFLLPFEVMLIPRRWEPSLHSIVLWVSFVCALASVAGIWRFQVRTSRGPMAALLWFVVLLAPTLGLVPFSYQLLSFVASRYAYLSMSLLRR